MNCPRCGATLTPGAQFCSACGTRFNPAPPPNYQPGAFAAGQYSLRKAAASLWRSMMSGEGIASEFVGHGEIPIQTRNLEAFAGLMRPFFPSQPN
jgi:hypothetical protein